MGPTGSGKTALAEALADRLDAQLVNADAFQVYRGLDVGTAKPAHKEHYALLDLREPEEAFGVGEWVQLALAELVRCYESGRSAVVVGGTGLNVRALFEEYANMESAPDPELREQLNLESLESMVARLQEKDPEVAASIDLQNPARVRRALERALAKSPKLSVHIPPFKKVKLAIQPSVAVLEERLAIRTQKMVQNGWLAEVESLRSRGVPEDAPGLRAIGYRSLYRYLGESMSWEESLLEIARDTKRYAKRQRTWLRSEPSLHWLESDSQAGLLEQAIGILNLD